MLACYLTPINIWVLQQGEICSSQHKEGWILGYLCQLCAHDGTNFNGIEGIKWQTTLHGESVACYENIGTCLIIMKKTIFTTIEPCRWGWTSILPLMEGGCLTNLHYVGTFHNPYLLFEAHLHDDAHAKETFNCVLKKNINSPSTYA